MKVATFIEPGKMTVTEAPVPEIQKDTDVISEPLLPLSDSVGRSGSRDKDLVLDWWGAILSVITFSSLVYSINGNVLRWLSGVICVFAFVTFL